MSAYPDPDFAAHRFAGAELGPPIEERPVVAIIGGGFSGVLTALHLLTDPAGPRVRLIERGAVFARGAAYSTENEDHLLNVRVDNMSAFPDQPRHFVDWLSTKSGWSVQNGFVTRGCYGGYLQDLLRQATAETPAGRLLLDSDEVVALTPRSGGWTVSTDMGRTLEADAVVLATGLLPPALPPGAEALRGAAAYVPDPWARSADLRKAGANVLLLGTGLTMVDVALELSGQGRRITALSRRGLVSRTHAVVPLSPTVPAPSGSPLEILLQVRRMTAEAGWRAAVDALRPYVQSLWIGWSLAQRRQFLRHLRPWWDVHRHRLAPSVARRVDTLRRIGELTVLAGRLRGVTAHAGELEIAWSPRGGAVPHRLRVDTVINCTGPVGDLSHITDRLQLGLLRQGLIRQDLCGLGVDVDEESRPLDATGRPRPSLFAVGPLTRGAFWEMTSVPDIRLQAARVARLLASELSARVRQGAA